MIIYTVRPGDTVYSISKQLGIPPQRLITDNGLKAPGRLSVGQSLVVLSPTKTYTVRGGDTLERIARMFGVSIMELWQNNPVLGGRSNIYPGQTLNINYPAPPLGVINVNGYAYPFIDEDVLRQTLPYLTYLSVFTYGIRADGTLVRPEGDDGPLVRLAREYGTVPLLMLTSLTEEGVFSAELVGQVISDGAVARTLAENTVSAMLEGGYGGVDVDFEYVPADSADALVRFVETLREAMPSPEYRVFVSMAPKSNDNMKGLLYEGHDYAALGEVADSTLVMTYEWGYTYGPPMAVAPIDKVEGVLDYTVSKIPADKVLMGVPNYGYNWTLPYVKGESRAQTVTNTAAIRLADDKNAAIIFDPVSATPYFKYYDRFGDRAVEHQVWFDDARSMNEKLRLVYEKGLSGISVWQIMNYFPALWSVLNSLYGIRKIQP